MNSKEKNERLSLALRKNLKKRKIFQKKTKKKRGEHRTVVVVRKIPVVELLRFKAGIAYWRFPTYVRTEGYLHILRAFGTRSLILRFQSFFSGDANPPFRSWLVFAFLSRRRRVILTQHRLLVIERIDVDAVRRLCFHRLLLLILYSLVRACLCKTNLPS